MTVSGSHSASPMAMLGGVAVSTSDKDRRRRTMYRFNTTSVRSFSKEMSGDALVVTRCKQNGCVCFVADDVHLALAVEIRIPVGESDRCGQLVQRPGQCQARVSRKRTSPAPESSRTEGDTPWHRSRMPWKRNDIRWQCSQDAETSAKTTLTAEEAAADTGADSGKRCPAATTMA